MFQVRIHGRGGQGVVTAAELLSLAAFEEGRYAQAFPSFGSERMGAPVVAFCRIDDKPIRLREPVVDPDAVIVQDPTLLRNGAVFEGLSALGYVLINTSRKPGELDIRAVLDRLPPHHVATVPATELALQHLGRPAPNTALLGGLAALTGRPGLEALLNAIRQRFPGPMGERNIQAARAAFERVRPTVHPEAGATQGAAAHA